MQHESNLIYIGIGIFLSSVAVLGFLISGEFPRVSNRPAFRRSDDPLGYWILEGALMVLAGIFWIALFAELSRG